LPLAGRFTTYDATFLASIDRAMNVFPADRIQTAEEWSRAIDPARRHEAAFAEVNRDQTLELSITRLIAETRIEAAVPDPAPVVQIPAPVPRVLEYIGFDNEPAVPTLQPEPIIITASHKRVSRWPGRFLRATVAAVVMAVGASLIAPLGQAALHALILTQAES
jgi:hypothetical protein